jgi:hypothetical protein
VGKFDQQRKGTAMSQFTKFWNKNGAHVLLYTTSALALVAQYAPAVVPQYGIMAAAGATALLGILHQVTGGRQPEPPPVVQPPPPVAKLLVLFAVGLLAAGSLQACKTLPTAQQQGVIAAAVDVATGVAIQQGTKDQTVWKERALKFKAVAMQLQAVNASGALSLATLAADLQPQIAKLGPADALAANALVAALTPYVQEQVKANPSLATTQTVVGIFLQSVIDACTVYGA